MSKYTNTKTPTAVMQELVVKIQQLRKKNGISQLELAKRSGVSFGSINNGSNLVGITIESGLFF